jgi:hypothetical protein
VQRLVVHPADHEHLAGVVLLGDRDDQALRVALEPGGDGGVEVGGARGGVHGPILPVAGCVRGSAACRT